MPTTFDFVNDPILPSNNPARPNYLEPDRNEYQQRMQQQPVQQAKAVDTPDVTIEGGHLFTIKKDNDPDDKTITTDGSTITSKQKTSRKKKESTDMATVDPNKIVRADGEVVETPTINTYFETAQLLKTSMMQIDAVSNEIKSELDNVRNSRTMKGKYNVMVGLAGNLSDLMEAKISAIKELNNCISKSNDMDYKREKDRKDAQGAVNDDKVLMDMYTAFVQNPGNINANNNSQNSYMTPIGPTAMAATLPNMNIVRASADSNYDQTKQNQDYANYIANMSPQMAQMIYEQNPDIKQCVVFDAATGAKWFQVTNIKTGQPIPNMPVHDMMFMEDTVLDLRNHIAKNNNLHETYPLIIINEKTANSY